MKRNRAERACQTRERSPAKFSRCGLSPPTAVVGSAHRSDTPVSGTHGPCARPPHRSPGIGSGSACGAPNPTAPSTPPSERPFPTRCERWWPPRSKKGVAPRDPRTAYRPSSECACPLPRAPPLLLPHSACSSPGARHKRRTLRYPQGHKLKIPSRQRVIAGACPLTPRADRTGVGARTYAHPQTRPLTVPSPFHLFIDKRFVLLNSIQNTLQLHPVPPCIGFCVTLPIQDRLRMRYLLPSKEKSSCFYPQIPRRRLFFQCASHRYQHFFGLLCRQHCATSRLYNALLTQTAITLTTGPAGFGFWADHGLLGTCPRRPRGTDSPRCRGRSALP